jgi:hypothetical protein
MIKIITQVVIFYFLFLKCTSSLKHWFLYKKIMVPWRNLDRRQTTGSNLVWSRCWFSIRINELQCHSLLLLVSAAAVMCCMLGWKELCCGFFGSPDWSFHCMLVCFAFWVWYMFKGACSLCDPGSLFP